MISKTKVLKHFGSVEKTADFFGISVQAVYRWSDPIPDTRSHELMLRAPKDFPATKYMDGWKQKQAA